MLMYGAVHGPTYGVAMTRNFRCASKARQYSTERRTPFESIETLVNSSFLSIEEKLVVRQILMYPNESFLQRTETYIHKAVFCRLKFVWFISKQYPTFCVWVNSQVVRDQYGQPGVRKGSRYFLLYLRFAVGVMNDNSVHVHTMHFSRSGAGGWKFRIFSGYETPAASSTAMEAFLADLSVYFAAYSRTAYTIQLKTCQVVLTFTAASVSSSKKISGHKFACMGRYSRYLIALGNAFTVGTLVFVKLVRFSVTPWSKTLLVFSSRPPVPPENCLTMGTIIPDNSLPRVIGFYPTGGKQSPDLQLDAGRILSAGNQGLTRFRSSNTHLAGIHRANQPQRQVSLVYLRLVDSVLKPEAFNEDFVLAENGIQMYGVPNQHESVEWSGLSTQAIPQLTHTRSPPTACSCVHLRMTATTLFRRPKNLGNVNLVDEIIPDIHTLTSKRSVLYLLDCVKTTDVTFFKGNDLRPVIEIVPSNGKRMVKILDLDDLSCHRRHIDQVEFNIRGRSINDTPAVSNTDESFAGKRGKYFKITVIFGTFEGLEELQPPGIRLTNFLLAKSSRRLVICPAIVRLRLGRSLSFSSLCPSLLAMIYTNAIDNCFSSEIEKLSGNIYNMYAKDIHRTMLILIMGPLRVSIDKHIGHLSTMGIQSNVHAQDIEQGLVNLAGLRNEL
ncbi:hypothetical protein CLF_111658 [Clonorchis sinensis]|uniref:Uncharacterized protein n=1 Tax=Clonorchis sinensis TaxID=79923 RepID=G7YLV2_CLOSI|nr:hypothetical protein CLF_111658 [Clonorchis sinensis]